MTERHTHRAKPAALETKRFQLALNAPADDGSFSGYASVFGAVDLGKDRVERGAFSRSLREKGKRDIRMLFQHDPSDPIGTWEVLREDDHGLFVKGQIAKSSRRGAEILELMRAGAINGLSIGFRTRRSQRDRRTGVRTIKDADLWEISVVTFPMLPQARVDSVKTATAGPCRTLPTTREFERWLSRDAGLSRRQARLVVAKGYGAVLAARDARETSQPDAKDWPERLRDAAAIFKSPGRNRGASSKASHIQTRR